MKLYQWTVKRLNTLGQTVALEKGQNTSTVLMDVRNLKNGLYIVEYQSAGEKQTRKVLVQH